MTWSINDFTYFLIAPGEGGGDICKYRQAKSRQWIQFLQTKLMSKDAFVWPLFLTQNGNVTKGNNYILNWDDTVMVLVHCTFSDGSYLKNKVLLDSIW